MIDFYSITKALSDENRVRVLMALSSGELCVCEVIELLQLAPSPVSRQMSILKQGRLIQSTKNGKWVCYLLPAQAPQATNDAVKWAQKRLGVECDCQGRRRLKTVQNLGLRTRPDLEVCQDPKAGREISRPARFGNGTQQYMCTVTNGQRNYF